MLKVISTGKLGICNACAKLCNQHGIKINDAEYLKNINTLLEITINLYTFLICLPYSICKIFVLNKIN